MKTIIYLPKLLITRLQRWLEEAEDLAYTHNGKYPWLARYNRDE